MATAKLLTAVEAARVVSKLTGTRCTPRRVRHLLVQCGLGTELQRRQQGQTRLFGALDLAFLRLAIELEQQGVSAWVARVVLTYLRDDIVRAFKSAAAVSLLVNGIRGRLEPTLRARPSSAAGWVALRDVWRGLEGEISALRDAKPTVWMWAEVPCHAVKRSTSGTPA